jgi:hypothetical protein
MKARPEERLSHWVDQLLERTLSRPCWFTAVDTGTILTKKPDETEEQVRIRRYNRENMRKWMGIKPHHLDWYVFQHQHQISFGHVVDAHHYGPYGLWAQFELKVGKNKPSLGQLQTIEALRKQGMQATVCWSLPEVFTFLNTMGFRLEANAEYVLKELMERYAAACREAER